MTKTEQIELQELGLTEAQIEARAQKLSAMLNDQRNEAAQDAADTPEKVQALMGGKKAMNPMPRSGLTGKDAAAWARVTDPNATVLPSPKPTKKTRSDKGKKRPAKPAVVQKALGALTLEQVDKIRDLSDATDLAKAEFYKAGREMDRANRAFREYLDSLTAK